MLLTIRSYLLLKKKKTHQNQIYVPIKNRNKEKHNKTQILHRNIDIGLMHLIMYMNYTLKEKPQ